MTRTACIRRVKDLVVTDDGLKYSVFFFSSIFFSFLSVSLNGLLHCFVRVQQGVNEPRW